MSPISFDPEDMIQGGLINDVTAKIKKAEFGMFTYPNSTTEVLSALITLVTDEGEELEVQPYSIGTEASKKFVASKDGKGLDSVSGATQLPKGSNFAILTTALREAGVPKEMIQAGDLSLFVGLHAFWQRKLAPERPGVPKSQAQIEKEKKYGPPSTLVPVKILAMPGEKGKARKASGGKTSAAPAASASNAADDATKYVLSMLGEAKEGDDGVQRITRKMLNTRAYSKLAQNPNKTEIIKLLADDGFVESLAEAGVAVDGDSLILIG